MATGIFRTFRPLADTVNAAVTTTAANLTLTGKVGSMAVRLFNSGSNTIFVKFTSGTGDATTTTSMPLAAGAIEVFTVTQDITTISHISGAAGNTLYATLGEGL